MDNPKPTTLEHLIQAVQDAAAQHPNPLSRLTTALMDVATSPADPYLIIDSLLHGIIHITAARVPLDRQQQIAAETEVQLSKLLVAWELK